MTHEKTLIREDKTKIKIHVSLYVDNFRHDIKYEVQIHYCEPRKRTWHSNWSGDDWSYRQLDQKGRDEFALKKQLELVTKEEIYQTKLELWEKLKPQP